MPKRVSTAHHEYGGKQHKPGDQFEVEPAHIQLLLLLERIAPEAGEPGFKPKHHNGSELAPATARRSGGRGRRAGA